MISGMKKLVLTAVLLPSLASADAQNYKYVEGGLDMLFVDEQTFIGPQIRGAFSFTDNLFALAGLRVLSDDVDYTNYWFGAAYNQAIDMKTSVWAGGSIEFQEYSYGRGFYDFDDTAPAIRGGVRHQLNQQLELASSARFVTGDADYFAISGTARFAITPQLHLLGELEIMDGEIGLLGGASFFF
ncbi:hypothetical protein [Allohahella sp. A8]|uniref:hypothetical protein n=1 Tax=Allohahella sp. A8 TaxID=3141461 RepID=UPI003A800159